MPKRKFNADGKRSKPQGNLNDEDQQGEDSEEEKGEKEETATGEVGIQNSEVNREKAVEKSKSSTPPQPA